MFRSASVITALVLGVGMAAGGQALAQANTEKPKYGGELNIGSVFATLPVLSWDPQDWNWKQNHDTGMYYEQLFAGDLSKAVRNGGKHRFVADGWLPSDAVRGELAEKWEWQQNPLSVVITLRKGVMFPDKPGVMKSRELTAEDVVFSFDRLNNSPKKVPAYYDYITKAEARDKYTVVFHFKEYSAEWDFRFGWGYYSGIVPREMANVDAKNWKNAVGSGPFQLTNFIQGNSTVYTKNPQYWGTESIGGVDYKLPFTDSMVYRTFKDESTIVTAFRTGKLDILEAMRWQTYEELKKAQPAIKWNRWLSMSGQFLAMRVDVDGPFKDIRVRRALNIAVNKQEIVKAFYNGHAELFAYPMHPDYLGYFEGLDTMPDAVKELFVYDPAKAKKLLAEAGYPNGFTFKVQVCSCKQEHLELLPLIAAYFEKIGVKFQIQPMENGAFLSAMTSRTHAEGYLMDSGHNNPTTSLRKSFTTGHPWNVAQWNDPAYDKKIEQSVTERDEEKRRQLIRGMTAEILEKAPYVWLPVPYIYTGWWPWVKNYGGELRAGAVRPGPIYARIWLDAELKKKMGF